MSLATTVRSLNLNCQQPKVMLQPLDSRPSSGCKESSNLFNKFSKKLVAMVVIGAPEQQQFLSFASPVLSLSCPKVCQGAWMQSPGLSFQCHGELPGGTKYAKCTRTKSQAEKRTSCANSMCAWHKVSPLQTRKHNQSNTPKSYQTCTHCIPKVNALCIHAYS